MTRLKSTKRQIEGSWHIRTISMAYRHTNIEQDILGSRVLQDLGERFPAMQIKVTLEEVIQTPITGNF